MRKIRNSKKGQSLVVSLLFIVVMTILVAVVGESLRRDKMAIQVESSRNENYYTAEAAEQLAKLHLEKYVKDKFETIKANWGGNIAARLITDPDNFFNDINNDAVYSSLVSGKVSSDRSYIDKNNTAKTVSNPDGSSYSYFFFNDKNNNGIKDAGEDGFVLNDLVTTEKKQLYKFQYNLTIYGYKGNSFANRKSTKKIYKTGVLSLEAGPDSFAKFALFTNQHITDAGEDIWFTDRTNFDGPVHTNGVGGSKFRFKGNDSTGKSATFTGEVTSVNTNIQWYNSGGNTNPPLSDLNPKNGTKDVPVFKKGYQRGAPSISLPANAFSQARASLGQDSSDTSNLSNSSLRGYLNLPVNNTAVPNDIYIPQNTDGITGVYVKGDVDSLIMSINASGQQQYTIKQGDVTKTLDIDKVNNQTIVSDSRPVQVCNQVYDSCLTTTNGTCKTWNKDKWGNNTTCKEYNQVCQGGYKQVCTTEIQTVTSTLSGVPKGSIYVEGAINFLGGPPRSPANSTSASNAPAAIESSTELTITAKGNITIQRDIKYQTNPLGPDGIGGTSDDNLDAVNVLGLFSSDGNVIIGTSAPNNIAVNSSIMAPKGVLKVDGHNSGVNKGIAQIVGGVITNKYGAFGLVSGSGYGRDYRYDRRFLTGKSPPYFPTVSGLLFRSPAFSSEVWKEENL